MSEPEEFKDNTIGVLKNKMLERVFSYLDWQSLRSAEEVCILWKEIIAEGNFWEQLYKRNILLYPDWVKINSVFRVKKPDLFIVNSQTENNNFHSNVCCQIGESIQLIESHWLAGQHMDTFCNLEATATSIHLKREDFASFFMTDSWFVRPLADGRIGVRNRWDGIENEYVAKLVPNAKIPVDNKDDHPNILSVQCTDEYCAAIGMIGVRKILFIFNIKEKTPGLLLRVQAWKEIEQPNDEKLYFFNAKDCFRISGDLLLLSGKKLTDKSTVFSLMNVANNSTIYPYKDIPSDVGLLCDFALDYSFIVLFFGTKSHSTLKYYDRYKVQVRDTITFDRIQSFVLPRVGSDICFFDYSKGIVVTGSTDSPIRIWNVGSATLDGDFVHGSSSLSGLRIVADRLIVSCDAKGLVKIWSLKSALDPRKGKDPPSIFLCSLEEPVPPFYGNYRQIKILSMRADALQIALVLQYDLKVPNLYVMDFSTSTTLEADEKKSRRVRKRRHV